jgi:hypothetical protein
MKLDVVSPNVNACQYKFTVNSSCVYVLWGNASLPLEGEVKVTDIYGNERVVRAEEVKLNDTPIYVEPIR